MNSPSPTDLGSYLKVGDAAAVPGVLPWTLRHWDREGKLKLLSHPVIGNRFDRREELIIRTAAGDSSGEATT